MIHMLAIKVRKLSYSYSEDKKVIDDISLNIKKGLFVSIVGHNGCGKSTLAKLLIGLLTPQEGEIYINNVLLNKKSLVIVRQSMALVFQNPDNQFIGSTVEDDIAFGLENRQVKHEDMQDIINKVADEVGMSEYLKKEPSSLSGGQKQRVAIAGALALNPDIIILDEATSMLDPKGKKDIRLLIDEMRKKNPDLTILSITHDIEEAYQSDEVIVMARGEIAAQGNPKEILKDKQLMLEAGLNVPFILSLKEKLTEQGLKIPDVNNIDELVEVLCPLK